MAKRVNAGIRVSNWVDHDGAENLLTWLYWRNLAHAKIFSNDIWRRLSMDSTLEAMGCSRAAETENRT